MSTNVTTTYSSSRTTTGVPSQAILLIAVLFAILWGALDINYHGHFSDPTIQKIARRYMERNEHLKDYLNPQMKDYAGQPETGTVQVRSNGRKIVITGKVVSE